MRRARCAALALWCAALPASATEPALTTEPGWLSEVLAPDLGARRSTQTRSNGLTTEAIDVRPLDSAQGSTFGVLPADQSGIPTDIWGDSDPDTLSALMTPYLPAALPEITAFWHRLALAEARAPGGGPGTGFLRARVDHLLNAGALDQAEALLESAGRLTPDLFRRAFDVGLLTGRADAACETMRSDPSLTPGIQARIYCLARVGDWSAAAITLRTAETLGQVSENEVALLSRFLDPEEFEDDPIPPHGELTALDFVMREALALPRAPGVLPLAFLHGDMDITAPWRNRVLATERLVRSQAVPPNQLLDLYLEGTPAASGGVWVRVEAVQDLMAEIDDGDPEAVGEALLAAHAALSEAGLGFALVNLAVNDLGDLEFDAPAARLRFDLWLMSPEYAELVWDYTPATGQEELLRAVALGKLDGVAPQSDIAAAVVAGLTTSDLRSPILWDVEQNRRGEAVLKALSALVQARHADPQAVETALTVLRRSGLEDEARRIALQTLLAAEGRL